MSRILRFRRSAVQLASLTLLALVAAMLASGCESDPTGPGIGNGDELVTTINGTQVTFDLTTAGTNYDPVTFYGTFHGEADASIRRSLLVTFVSDIGSGSYPRVVQGPNANFTYIEVSGVDTTIYNCDPNPTGCALTLTASNGSIVDGTFDVTLSERSGTRQVALRNGRFSVKFR